MILFLIILLTAFLLLFERKPKFAINPNDNILISPANGTVKWIKKNNSKITIHLFIGLDDIHYQIAPISGIIINQKYYNTNLFSPANTIASKHNERFITYIKDNKGKIIQIDQIAGIIARRIYNFHKVNDNIKQGEYLGIITLGSGAEITFDINSWKLLKNIIVGSKISLAQTIAKRIS